MDRDSLFHVLFEWPDGSVTYWEAYTFEESLEFIPDVIARGSKLVGFVCESDARGHHVCEHSAIYEDVSGIADGVQTEWTDLLDTERYIVCWNKFVDTSTLDSVVDFGLSKENILQLAALGKYREGASYIPVDKLLSLVDVERALGVSKENSLKLEDKDMSKLPQIVENLHEIVPSSYGLPDVHSAMLGGSTMLGGSAMEHKAGALAAENKGQSRLKNDGERKWDDDYEIKEDIVNISMMAAKLLQEKRIDIEDVGFTGLTSSIIFLADKFAKKYQGYDWNAEVTPGVEPLVYWEEIDKFAEKELLDEFGVPEKEVRFVLEDANAKCVEASTASRSRENMELF